MRIQYRPFQSISTGVKKPQSQGDVQTATPIISHSQTFAHTMPLIRFGIHPDSQRFDDLIRGKQRQEDIFKYISHREMKVGKDGKISFPMPRIDHPDFRRDSGDGTGQGTGSGKVGDEVKPGQKGQGEGPEAGEEEGEHKRENWGPPYSPSEIAKMIGEDIGLPNLKPKSKGKMQEQRMTWNSRNPNPPGRRLLRQTMLNAYKRTASEAKRQGVEFDPQDISLIRPDIERLSFKHTMKPSSKTVIFYLMDVSGSVTDEMKQRARTNNFILSTLLKYKYGQMNAELAGKTYSDKEFYGRGVEERFIIHDSKAQVVSEDEFYTTTQSGGTEISTALEATKDLIKKKYPPDQWNIYIMYYGDSDNFSTDDEKALKAMDDLLGMDINLFGYVHLESKWSGFGNNFKAKLDKKYGNKHPLVHSGNLKGSDYMDYKKVIRDLLSESGGGGK